MPFLFCMSLSIYFNSGDFRTRQERKWSPQSTQSAPSFADAKTGPVGAPERMP